ncbi:MAG: FMN-binding negative transcriptional regulator [Hyphomonadaceae bacterium]|nr:MAG: FMN-binding negative transcriptional regulator [Caulobacteraceae bacterium]MBT9445897.1 FMN-binding negative transcriptional regulator [Hyphomonadaceae bacterium]TPW08561.1 MAG: FMN-binding negative transcriptional regulator [Alphaproteobacteria bacterium]
MYGHPETLLSPAEARAALETFDRTALLVTTDLAATHLPFLVKGDRLIGHVARANAHWKSAPCEALVVMAGVEAYVSPNWYPSKAGTGRAVPTWNYETIHVRGHLSTFEDSARLEDLVARLSDRHEAGQSQPWTIAEAPRDYIDALLRGIVGVEIAIESIEAKRKLSQDRPAPDHAGVIAGLDASDDPRDRAVAKAMRKD